MPLADLFQVQPDEILGVGMRLVTIDDLLAGVGVQVGRKPLLGAGGEEDLLGSQLIVNLGIDKSAGIQGAAGGEALDGMGFATDVRPAREVRALDEYRAVIVGSAVQMGRWQADALDFLKRFERDLVARPTWLFSSGPNGGSAEADAAVARALTSTQAIPAPKDIARWAARIGAREPAPAFALRARYVRERSG